MTHDELVRFAAGKLEIVVCDKWERFNSTAWSKTVGSCTHKNCCPAELWPPDLTSPELFLKGLEAYAKDGAPFQLSWWGVKLGVQNMAFEKIEDIPLKFWECWFEAELEGGQG